VRRHHRITVISVPSGSHGARATERFDLREDPEQRGVVLQEAGELGCCKQGSSSLAGDHLRNVGIQDHPYQHHFFDTWSLIPTLLAETRRMSFFTDVASLPLRPPAVMAKAAASLDVLSGGRFELGLGGGALPELIANFGGPRRTPGETVETVDEAIDVIRLLWSDQRSVSFEGRHYRLNDERSGPRPAHPIAIWLGAFTPRTIRLMGRKADGWLPSLGVLTPVDPSPGQVELLIAEVVSGLPSQLPDRGDAPSD
jgi:hypothetical protein